MAEKVDGARDRPEQAGDSADDQELKREAKLDRAAAEVREKVSEIAGRLKFGADKK